MKLPKIIAAAWLLLPALVLGALDVPPLTGRVVDRAGVFGSAGKQKIEAAIQGLEQATGGGQMAVLTVKTLDGAPIEDFGIAVMDKWKIGQKGKDNGIILILAVNDRKMRLEVGYGWEGEINDARAGDVIRAMAPFLRENQYTEAAVYAVGEVQRYVTGKAPEGHIEVRKDNSENDPASLIIIVVLVVIFMFFGRGGGVFIGGFGGGGGGGFSGGGGRGGGGGASGGW